MVVALLGSLQHDQPTIKMLMANVKIRADPTPPIVLLLACFYWILMKETSVGGVYTFTNMPEQIYNLYRLCKYVFKDHTGPLQLGGLIYIS